MCVGTLLSVDVELGCDFNLPEHSLWTDIEYVVGVVDIAASSNMAWSVLCVRVRCCQWMWRSDVILICQNIQCGLILSTWLASVILQHLQFLPTRRSFDLYVVVSGCGARM